MKTKFGIVGCGFLGNIVADAWKKGLLEDYELVGVTSRTFASAEKTAASVGCAACADVDALLALEPEFVIRYIVAHEVSHLKHQDHSPYFWALVEFLEEDASRGREWLTENGHLLYTYK